MNVIFGGRSLRVDTQPPPRLPMPQKKTAPTTPSAGFMKSTVSSSKKGSPANITQQRSNSPLNITHYRNIHADDSYGDQSECENKEEKLTHNVLKFTRSSDRKMLLRTLRDCPFLQSISVDDTNSKMHIPHSSAEWKELENEVASSIPMELNGIMFGANVDDKNKVYEGERFLQLLHLLCIRLTQSAAASTVDKHNNNNRMNPDDLYKALLVRLSPKNGTSTGYSLVNRLIGSKELVVQVPKKPIRPVSRPSLVIYASGSNIHAIVDHHQTYGLYRKSDAAGKPWIGLTTIYHERVNLSSGKSVRRVNVQVHEEKFSPY